MTLQQVTDSATWEVINLVDLATNAPYSGAGITISQIQGDNGFLQLNLSEIPTTGVSFQVRAGITVNGQTLTDTVSATAIGTP